MDPIKPWDYCDCDPPPKLYVGNNGVIQDVINGQTAQVPGQYQTDTTPIPTATSIATSSVPHSALPTSDTSFDSFNLKSFQFPDSMPVYNFKGKCLRHCSTSNSDNLSDHYPFQVSVIIRDRFFRKVFSFQIGRKKIKGDIKNMKSGVLIRSNIVLTAASILFDSQNRRYRHSDIKVTVNLEQADEQVRMAKAGIHHRKFSFHHGRNNIGMIVLRKPFQLVPGSNLT